MSSTLASQRLPDNTVQYFLYPDSGTFSSQDVTSALNQLIVQYTAHLTPFLVDYIWQNESFTLRPVVSEAGAYIYGKTNFEDNIEDEYFIIFLLCQLTLFDQSLVAKVGDEDGEILLIESAQYLERWAQDPSRTENRVYLHRGEMHLISPTMLPNWSGTDPRKFPFEAANFVLKNCEMTKCNDSIQRCLSNRTKAYPANIRDLQHRAHCYLPVAITSLLGVDPKLISTAVRAFYYRTPEDLKSIAPMKHLPAQSCILSNVTFTRCLFAQLTSQEYKPDRRINWPFPSQDADSYNSYLNGFKVAAGFEILIARFLANSKARKDDQPIQCIDANNALWQKFLSHLKSNDYFGDEPVGSKLYNEKLQKCKLFFPTVVTDCSHVNESVETGGRIHDYVDALSIEEELKRWQSIPVEAEDDSSWLYLDQEGLDQLLADKFGCSSPSTGADLEDISKNIPETIRKFVFNENSGLKGAEAPKVDNQAKSDKQKSKIQIDKEEFANFVKEIKFLVDKEPNIDDFLDDNTTDSSSLEDYGSDTEEFDDLPTCQKSNDETGEVKAYLKQMDSELAKTFVGESFKKCPLGQLDSDDDDDDDEDSTEKYSNAIDLNVLSNILDSYSAESEMANSVGPATTLFAAMGSKLPDIEKKPN